MLFVLLVLCLSQRVMQETEMRINSLVAAMALMAGSGMSVLAGPEMIIEAPPTQPKMRPKRVLMGSAPSRVRGRLPHIGAKERARHAGKPDGPMHGLPMALRLTTP